RAGNALVVRIEKVRRAHLAVGGFRVVIGDDRAGIEIGRKRLVAGEHEAVANALDLILQAPPFLDDHDARRLGASGLGEVAGRILAVRLLEDDLRAHASSACWPSSWSGPACRNPSPRSTRNGLWLSLGRERNAQKVHAIEQQLGFERAADVLGLPEPVLLALEHQQAGRDAA